MPTRFINCPERKCKLRLVVVELDSSGIVVRLTKHSSVRRLDLRPGNAAKKIVDLAVRHNTTFKSKPDHEIY